MVDMPAAVPTLKVNLPCFGKLFRSCARLSSCCHSAAASARLNGRCIIATGTGGVGIETIGGIGAGSGLATITCGAGAGATTTGAGTGWGATTTGAGAGGGTCVTTGAGAGGGGGGSEAVCTIGAGGSAGAGAGSGAEGTTPAGGLVNTSFGGGGDGATGGVTTAGGGTMPGTSIRRVATMLSSNPSLTTNAMSRGSPSGVLARLI